MIAFSVGLCCQAVFMFILFSILLSDKGAGVPQGDINIFNNKHTSNVRRIYPSNSEDCSCKPGQISCLVDCSCILTSQVCDNIIDCTDGRDETNCTPQLCHGRFACRSGECVRQELTCDGVQDCVDGSDELMCRGRLPESHVYNCSGDHVFNCTDGAYCVPSSWKCDGDFDCYDKSDEVDCVHSTTCQPNEFKCRTGKCINLPFVCDGRNDCEDGSDEINCPLGSPTRKCNETEFNCTTAGRCVAKHYVCDGEDDCGDWSDEKNCNVNTSCSNDNFRCKSGRCIETGWVCDGTPDCEENEDEENCPNPNNEKDCPLGTFFCPNVCISYDWRCDGEFDCPGGEDELRCEDESSCGNDMFSCGYGRRCIPKYKICDGQQDCLDGKDEYNCSKSPCHHLKCSYGCHVRSDGREMCICPVGFNVALNNDTCADVNECEKFSPCSQMCENSEGNFKCSCASGYDIRPDKMTCKAQSPPAKLIFATRDDIREINLSGQEYPPIVKNLENAIAVDFHYRRGLIYWTDVTIDAILMAYQNGSGKAQIVRWGLQQPCGLSVDWYNDHIYWVDSITRRVEVADWDGNNRRPLIWTDLQKPRSIVVYPKRSLIIWTDWGDNARIEKAFMDGSGRSVLIGERLYWPNGITIDYPTETLYWVDAKQHVIEEAHIDGTRRRKVNEHKIPHPFGITVFEDRLYWSDWKMRSIRSINKRTGRDMSVVHSNVPFPMGIKSMHPQRQPILGMGHRSGCSWENGGCSHLCLPSSKSTACFCPHGLYLLDDRRTCSSKPDLLLLFAQRNTLRMIPLQQELDQASEPHLVDKSIFKTSDDENYEAARPRMDNVVPVDSVQMAMALDYDEQQDMIYWTDFAAHSLSRAHLNGSGQQILASTNIELPCGLAVDWYNHKLYWTDRGANRIEVANLDGTNRAILVWDGVKQPRDIVVNPKEGILFWSEWDSNASINRVFMDGTEPTSIARTNLTWPNGLAVDYETDRLFWLDAKAKIIESSDFDGKNRRELFGENLRHPFGLALYKEFIFWSDWDSMGIFLANKNTGFARQQLVRGLKDLMGVQVFHKRDQDLNRENPCEMRNGGCSHLCLLRGKKEYSCACPTGILLQKDKRKCHSSPSEWLIMAHRTAVRTLSLNTPYLADVTLPLPILHNVVALDVDSVTGDLLLPDSAAACILRCTNDWLQCKAVVSSAIETVEGIAVEPTTRKMYWTDLKRRCIEVSDLDGLHRRVLFTGLDKPRAIVTHYPSGRFYWTDWAKDLSRIEVADLDGKNRRIFVKDDVVWPNGLSIDWATSELFWTDAKLNRIEAIRLDGRDRRIVVSGKDVSHPYGLTVLGDWVYWTDWVSKSLLRAKKNSGQRLTRLIVSLPGLMDIKGLPGPKITENVCGSNNGGCSDLCLRNPQGYSCACSTGLLLVDGKKCDKSPTKYLVVTSKGILRRISLDATPLWDVGLEVPGVYHPVSLDADFKKQTLYFVDSDVNSLKIVSMKNLSYPRVVKLHAFTAPDGIALDWIANNLYWTDALNALIEVAHVDSFRQKALIKTDLQEPRAIAVFPEKGLLFWTDWGNNSKIERSSLDGSNRMTIVDKNIGWPNGLVVDLKIFKIFWTDARKNTIETADLDGTNRAVLLEALKHPFGVTLLDDYIYWTEWESQSVERAEKHSGLERQVIVESIEQPMEIIAVDENARTGWNPCAERNGGCTHLCLFKAEGEVVCACPDASTPSCSTSPLFKVDANSARETDPRNQDANLGPNFIITVVILGIFVGAVFSASVGGALCLRCRRLRKAHERSQTSETELTFTNPTYTSTNLDENVDAKHFSLKRLQRAHQNQYEERGEVTALINAGVNNSELDKSPTVRVARN